MRGKCVLRFVGNRQVPEEEAVPHLIPPMTHPLSKYWEQPDRSMIEITDKVARLPRAVLEELAEYSRSIPTGAYEGKMWRRRKYRPGKPILESGTGEPTGYCEPIEDGWFLCWYGPSDDPEKVSINSKVVEVVEE